MIEQVRAISDDEERARTAHEMLREIAEVHPDLADIRREAVLALRKNRGWNFVRIAAILDVTKMTAGRIARGRDTRPPATTGGDLNVEKAPPGP